MKSQFVNEISQVSAINSRNVDSEYQMKQPLSELRVSNRQFTSILTDRTIQMGFECEMVLPSKNDEDAPPLLSAVDSSWDEIKHYLVASVEDHDQMRDDYRQWLRQTAGTIWREEEPDADQSDFEAWYKEHRAGLRKEYPINYWIEATFDDCADVIAKYHLRARYGRDEDGFYYTETPQYALSDEEVRERAAESLSHFMSEPATALDEYHAEDKDPDEWYVEPDGSIHHEAESEVDVEVVSPVYSLSDGLANLKGTFAWMGEVDARTNASTGLHINLSIKGKRADDYDYVKMILFFDENYVAKQFGRLDNTYARMLRTKLSQALRKLDFDALTKDIAKLRKALLTISADMRSLFDRYVSINMHANGVVEFRSMGGSDYQRRFDEIRRNVVQMAYVLKLGASPDLMLDDYLHRLFAFLKNGRYADAMPGAGTALAGTADPREDAMNDLTQRVLGALLFKDDTPAQKLCKVARALRVDNGEHLSPRLKSQIVRFARRSNLSADVMFTLLTTADYNALAAVMGWALRVASTPAGQGHFPFVRPGPEPAEERPEPGDPTADTGNVPLPFHGDDLEDVRGRLSPDAFSQYRQHLRQAGRPAFQVDASR